jgi:uncharacterized protein (DUF1330 family)
MPRTLCVLLWAHPGAEAALATYEDRVLRLVPDHGGRVVLRARNSGVPRARGTGTGTGGQPVEIQLIEFPAAAALDAYMSDPRRTAMAADRDRAVARTEIIDVDLVPPAA